MNYIKDIPLQKNNHYNVIIEILKNTKDKTELQEPMFNKLEKVTKMSKKYPYYYGCFPQTLAGDNDPLDMILLTNKPRNKLDIVNVEPLGMITTNDYDCEDNKILVKDIDEVIKDIEKYEQECLKFLQKVIAKNSQTKINDIIYDKDFAIKVINKAHEDYLKNKNEEFKVIL